MSTLRQLANGGTVEESLGQNSEDSLGKNEIFDVLRNERRRYVLRHLDRAGGAIELGELSEALAKRESDDGTFDHRYRKRAYVSLHQNHLPKMDDIGIIKYDKRSKRVQLAPAFDQVKPYLYSRQNTTIRWPRLYLIVGLIGVGIAIPGQLWSPISGMVWFGMLAGMACFLVGVHFAFSQKWINTNLLRE